MSERHILWMASAMLLVVGIIGAFAFVASGYSFIFMVGTAICIIGSFMAFLTSFASR